MVYIKCLCAGKILQLQYWPTQNMNYFNDHVS